MNRAISSEEMRSAPKKGAFSKAFPSKRFVKLGRKTSEGSLHSSSSTGPSAETDVTVKQPSKSRLHRYANRLSGVFFPASSSSSGSVALGSGVRWSYRDKKRCNDLEPDNNCELSSQITAPGILKVFGGEICRGAHYKSVLASTNSSAAELVKEALDRYGLNKDEADSYVLCDTIGSISSHQWKTEGFRVVGSNEKPLLLQSLWKPREGLARRFEIQKRSWVEEQASKDRDTITAGINAQARRLQKSHSRVKSTLIEKKTDRQSQWRNGSVLDLSNVGQTKDQLIDRLEEPLGQDSNVPSERFKEDYVQLTSAPEEESGPQDETETLCPLEPGGEREAEESEREETESSDDNNTQFSIHPPRDCPYLLLLQGYSLTQDFVIYLLANPTILIGSPHGTGKESKPDIVLASPDILPKHCCLHRLSLPGPTVLRPCQGATVMRNGEAVNEEVLLAPGDVIGLGHNYLFLFKDHLNDKEGACCEVSQSSVSPATGLMQHPNAATESEEKIMPTLCSINSPPFIISQEGRYFTLSYPPEDEARIISEIVAMGDTKTEDRPPLSVAFLLCVCLQCSSARLQTSDLRRLLLLTASRVQSSVWDYTKKLAAAQTEVSVGVGAYLQDLISGLRPLVTWLSNSLELLQFIQTDLLMILRLRAENEREEEVKSRVEQAGSSAATELYLSQVQSASEETTTVLEEVIMLCFQQCVYYITKVLHPILTGLLDCNPFRESADSPTSGGLKTPYELEQLVLVMSETGRLLSGCLLHPEMSSQLMAYLFYFINASLFNSLMERGSERGFYQWSRGVCMRANLDLLLDWAHTAGLGELALEHTLTFSTAINLLATPRKNLLQTSWASLRREYPTLSPAQLNHLLSFYSPASPCRHIWTPSVEDRAAAHDTADILEDFDEHHPLVLPDVGDDFHLRGTVADSGLVEQLSQLKEFIKNLSNSNSIKDSFAQPLSLTSDLSCTNNSPQSPQNMEPQAEGTGCSENMKLDLDPFITHTDTPKLQSDIWKKFDIDSSPHGSAVETLEDGGLVSECLAALRVGRFKGEEFALIEEEEEDELFQCNNELFSLELRRGKRGLGLSLVDTSETSFKAKGMLVRAVLPDSPAGRCGKLLPGDQILAVNAVSLIDLDYQSGKELIRTSGDRLKLLVARSGWTHQTMRTDC
ncbi:ras-associating and dilute domain-containing protein [Neosynchiropus ocellatus]